MIIMALWNFTVWYCITDYAQSSNKYMIEVENKTKERRRLYQYYNQQKTISPQNYTNHY